MFSITRVLFFTLQITVLLESFVVGLSRQSNGNSNGYQRFAMEPQDQTAVVGSRVTLPCRVVAKTGQLQWTKDDFGLGEHRNLTGFERYSMVGSDEEGDYSLDIFPIMLDDDAVYQCQVGPGKRGIPPIRSKKAKLTVLVPPDNPTITQGSHIVTTEDREIELECVSKGGKPPAEITWIDGFGNVIKDGIEYFHQQMENSKLFEARSILKFVPKMEHHNSTMTCQAQNTADRTYKSARLKFEVKFAPKVTVSVISGALANGRIQEGAEVRLACRAEANPPELNFKWYINENKIAGDSTELIIPNITRDFHDSIVKCEVSNNVGKSMDSETIDITYAPFFKIRPQSVESDEGAAVTLTCDVDGNPVPEIVWIYDGLDRVVATTTNLTITVSHDTVGRYLCKASVPGFPDIIEQATVYLKGPPTISSSRRQFGTPGEMSRVECIAFSIPKARHVGWTFSGREINVTGSSVDDEFSIEEEPLPFGIKSTLIIRQSAMRHFGRYNCTVINDYGYDVMEIELNGESKYNSQLFFACFGGAISFVCLVIIVLAWLMCIKKTKKKLPPADVIPDQNYKGCKESDCSSNKSDMKINRENEYLESYSSNDLGATKIPLNTFNMPMGGQIPDFRYSGDYTDSFGQMQTTKLGINNNGYIPYVDYNRDYTPPPATTTHNHVRTTNNTSLSNHLIMCTSTATPTITSASIVGISTGTITNGTYSLTRNRPLDRLLHEHSPTLTPTANGLMTNHNALHVNVDPRYSTLSFGNQYMKQVHSPMIISNAANQSQTPAPPPYHSSGSRGSNSNSSFSSSTTISNINGGGSLVGIVTTTSNGGGSIPSQTPSPSGQFIVPANTKIGALATHV